MSFTIEFVRFLMRNAFNSSDKMHKHYIRFPSLKFPSPTSQFLAFRNSTNKQSAKQRIRNKSTKTSNTK